MATMAENAKQPKVSEAKSDATVGRRAKAGHTSADAPMAEKAKEKEAVAPKSEAANGSYEFLVGHFSNPSTIIDAATALAQQNGIDPSVAVKKIETFLENAKLDRTLEVRAGSGRNEGQYLINRVPKSTQKRGTGGGTSMKAKKRDVTPTTPTTAKREKKSTTTNGDKTLHLKITQGTLRAGNKRGAAVQFWATGYHTVETVVAHLKKQFNESDAKLRSAATEIFRHAKLRDRLKVKVLKKEQGDTVQYTVVPA